MEEKPNPRRPLIVYYIGSLLLIMLFNAIVYPILIRSRINEVDYSTFLQLVEEGRVRGTAGQRQSTDCLYGHRQGPGVNSVCHRSGARP